MRKGRLKGRSGQPALTFFPTASVGPSVLSTCISKPGPSGRPIRKKSPVDSLIDPLLTLTSCPPVVTPPRLICSDPHRYRVDCALSLTGSKSGSTPTPLWCEVREKGRGRQERDTQCRRACPLSDSIQDRRSVQELEGAACTGRAGKTTE